MAAANRVAADNPLHEGDQTAVTADGGLFPRIEHPYPCDGCAAFHDDESGFCAQCSRRRLVPPHTVAMLARAQRRFYLALLTLIMSMFETSDKVIIATFAASTTLVVLLWFLTNAVASQGRGPWIAGLVLVVVAAVCCGPVVRRMIQNIEAVDAISGEFEAASTRLLADRDESQRGPASFKPSDPPRQPGRELRDIYVKARERRDLFAVEILEAVARAGKQATEPSREIRGPNVKHLSRAREKIVLDYGGDANQLRDVLRGSVVCETVDELDVVIDALRAVKDVEIIRIKNRFRDKPTPSGYRDVNINLVYHGLVVELQLHLSEVLQVADRQHVAYEAARELDLMGVLEKPDASSLSETAPIEMKVAYNLARFVPALLSLFIAILYLDVFTFKRGLRLIVRRADPDTWRGFEQPHLVHRVYGIALAAPYLANVYMLARAAGLFGEAAKDARRGRTRVGLLYEKYFGYEGSHFVWKVFCFQIVEVALQAVGKIPLFMSYSGGGGATFGFLYVFILALLVNVLYPTLLLRSRLVRYQRDVSFVADTFLDVVYAVTPFMFLFSGVRSQAVLIPHEPVAYVSNLIPMLHAHFVISTLERAGAEARALKRVAPNEIATDEAPKRAVADAPDEAAGIDAPAPDASAEPSKPAPLGATPAGHRYRGLVCLGLFFWTLAMGFFYTRNSPTFWFVSRVLKIKSSCTWKVDKGISTYDACCVEHEFDATGQKVSTTCHWDRGGTYEGGSSPWEAATMSKLCTKGHSDAGAVAPAYRDCSQKALDAGRCGTGDWDTCAECADFDIPTGNYFANVGYTSCPNWVFDAISEDAADGGTCSDAWNKRTDFWRFGEWRACSFQLWEDFTASEPWPTKLGFFALLSLVCLPSILSFLASSTFVERPDWRRRGLMLLCFSGFLLGPYTLILFLVVLGYKTAVVTEERVKLGAFCSVVIFLTVKWKFAVGCVVLGCAAVAFAPRRGERKKVRSAVFTTKASVAADRGRLPRWACAVYFCATVTFIALASSGVFSTIDDRCSPCNCKDDTLIDCYADAKTLVLTDTSWNRIDEYLPEERLKLRKKGIKAIEPGAFEGMARLEDYLGLGVNDISIIEPYTFVGLNKLRELRLSKNKIRVVKSDAFRGLHSLRILRLDKNQINRIENGAFTGLNSLRRVKLQNNPVTCADAHAAGLPQSVECQGY